MYQLGKKILIIEDDIVTRNIFLEALTAEKFETIEAENGVIGIEKARNYLPDLIICDIVMPDMDGYTVLSNLRQDAKTAIVPFIFLTGSDTKADFRKGMELGADDYLTKPSTIDELLKAVNTRLQKQSLLNCWCVNSYSQLAPGVSKTSADQTEDEAIFPAHPQLQEVFDFIEAHYNEGITLCDVAEAVGYSSAYLTNRVAKQTGDTVNGWIVKRRMLAARCLLRDTNQNIEQIATALGYQNACHFSRQFRQHHGMPPQSWRKECQLTGNFLVAAN